MAQRSYIVASNLFFSFQDEDDAPWILNDLSFEVKEGEYLAVLGANGSGKSTLARHLNTLYNVQKGSLIVAGFDASDESLSWNIRQSVGMVFQNPDNALVATSVEEDIAFGLENLGLDPEEMNLRISEVLELLDMSDQRQAQLETLSGGQKQKLALAGVLAMRPKCLILDESTSMLDPQMRQDLLKYLYKLHQQENLTIIHVTHYMDEILKADRVFLMGEGRITKIGSPLEVFSDSKNLKSLNLEAPLFVQAYLRFVSLVNMFSSSLSFDVKNDLEGFAFPKVLDEATFASELANFLNFIFGKSDASFWQLLLDALRTSCQSNTDNLQKELELLEWNEKREGISDSDLVIEANSVSFSYPFSKRQTLKDISFSLKKGECLALVGHSGSGKSTLILQFNALLQRESGFLKVLGYDPSDKNNIISLRKNIGLLFQYPEDQLFAETIREDICFGPEQLGVEKDSLEQTLDTVLNLLNIPKSFLERSPFELSGGQMRRVAMAGVLIMKPKLLILDEPAAGLDPKGRQDLLTVLDKLKELGVSIVLVSHNMDEVLAHADKVLVLKEGKTLAFDTAHAIFSNQNLLREAHLEEPSLYRFFQQLAKELGFQLNAPYKNLDEALIILIETFLKFKRGEA